MIITLLLSLFFTLKISQYLKLLTYVGVSPVPISIIDGKSLMIVLAKAAITSTWTCLLEHSLVYPTNVIYITKAHQTLVGGWTAISRLIPSALRKDISSTTIGTRVMLSSWKRQEIQKPLTALPITQYFIRILANMLWTVVLQRKLRSCDLVSHGQKTYSTFVRIWS